MKLVILAAGMGSRYGGLKQLDPITKSGEFIIDFSCYDAMKCGFDEIVFIIKKDNYELFEETIGKRVSKKIKVSYAFQDVTMLPNGYTLPSGRTKPWGTGHALLCAKNSIGNDSFVVINADDFYGYDSFRAVSDFLKKADPDGRDFCMAGFVLKNTLTENGSVSRGICNETSNGYLVDVTERTMIFRENGNTVYQDNGINYPLDENSNVSMNFWGFTCRVFEHLESDFKAFLDALPEEKAQSGEFYIPYAVTEMLKRNDCRIRVLPVKSKWFGVTYAQDKPIVVESIKSMTENGIYPEGLWK